MKKFKSLLAVVLTFAMLFALAGCAEKPQAEREDDETEAKETSSETSSETNTPETNTPDYDVSDENVENDSENTEENTGENTDTSGLPEIPGVDFAYEIENFVSTPLNTTTLKVGEGHTPTAAVWAKNGGSCYTSDASVVEVAKNGNVFAKGAGTAYVVITGIGSMYDVYKYEVVG